MKISVLESGSWGTALASVLARNGHEVTLHSLHSARSALLSKTHENPKLPGVILPEELRFTDGFGGVEAAEAVFVVTPSVAVRQTAHALRGLVRDDALVVSAAKGIEKGSSLRMSEVIAEELGARGRLVVLSGPSHAEEVGRGIPTGLVSASEDRAAAESVQDMLMNRALRVYTSSDCVGVELCGALKNIIAICAGISFGLGYGDNTSAMLMTRGLSEMTALGEALGGARETFAGLAGVGDLIVTCTSTHSRNRTAGFYIGQGMSVDEALKKVGAVVEGYYATQSTLELSARVKVEMPIAEALGEVLFAGGDPGEATLKLMNRAKKGEE